MIQFAEDFWLQDAYIRPFVIVPANADVIMTAIAIASTTAVSVSGGFNTILAINEAAEL